MATDPSGGRAAGGANAVPRRRRPPLHPLLVTVPIGCWAATLVFDIASRYAAVPATFTRGAIWLLGIGLASAVVAALPGFVDAMPIGSGTPAHRLTLAHMGLAIGAVVLYAVAYVLQVSAPAGRPVPVALVVFAAANLVVLAAAGYAGGVLAHRHGVAMTGSSPVGER
ncbi:DUF2231 domain-containing protein [Gandjariella thermophila]|uniref:DUF2231 domain-containing protein n=1 Tax=Gandjariella thermophila TaxID=1931992 RepID=A0A4D4IVT3_9PSEU|nr:DUF2231 domain-containing protein [Gandjariella thermophila]GDY28455.1 hypothetical protein GTS_00880 [Gandjariella thermophila]